MPNWTYNHFTISGNSEDMKEFYDLALKPNVNGEISFKFSNIFPVPEKIKNTISPSSSAKGRKWMNETISKARENTISSLLGEETDIELIPVENNTDEKCEQLRKEFGADNWYDWNINNFGTKWDCEAFASFKGENVFECDFDTAWTPPTNFLEKLQVRFPSLDIRLTYELEGSDECGVFFTNRDSDIPELYFDSDNVEYLSYDGREIYIDKNGDWRYTEDDEVCYDVYRKNPFE